MADEFDITSRHPEYEAKIAAWNTMRDAIDGEDAIKAKQEYYLPMKSGIKAINDNRRREEAYAAYILRAEFPELLAPTIRGSMGLIHSKESVIELPAVLEPLREKATKDGLTLQQLHQKITVELLRAGRFVLLPGIQNGEFHIASYVAESFINWDDNEGNLVYAVLEEAGYKRNLITNKWEEQDKFRELYLDERGLFVSRMWVEVASEGKDKTFIPLEEERATIKGRAELDLLPVVTMGTQDLTVDPDELPLYGLAKLALRSYRLDADYTNALHMTSEPTPVVTGVSQEEAPQTIGAGGLWIFESDSADAKFLEFSGPGVAAQHTEIQSTQERAIMFGAQLFAENKRTAESGEAIKLRLGSQTSSLKMISASSAAGLEQTLKFTAIWAGANPDEVSVTPNMEFIEHELSPQEITALVASWQAGAYSKATLFDNLQRGNIIDPEKTFEEEQDLIELDGDLAGLGKMDDDDEIPLPPESISSGLQSGFLRVVKGGS
jgi:hypothetical protein